MIWKECVLLDECYFLSIKHCHHWSLLLLYLVAPKGAVFVLTFTYCSRSKSIAFMRSEMDSPCSATLLRRTNSLECWICFFATLAMKFLSRNTRKYFFLSGRYGLWSSGSVSTNVLCGRERSLSTSKSACEMKVSSSLLCSIVNLSCHTLKQKCWSIYTHQCFAHNQLVVCFIDLCLFKIPRFESVN